MFRPNARGVATWYDPQEDLGRIPELEELIGEACVDMIEMEFLAEVSHVPARYAADPDDSYPEENDDERWVQSISLVVMGHPKTLDVPINSELGVILTELMLEDVYCAEVFPLVDPEDPYDDDGERRHGRYDREFYDD